LSAQPDSALVFDVGGSHISSALCLLARLELSHVARIPIPAEPSVQAFLNALIECGEQIQGNRYTASGVSIAIAGPFDYTMGISRMQHKLEYLYGFDLKRPIAERFGWSPERVLFLKDAEAFLLGELRNGIASHAEKVMGITLGTGIGSAFAEHGLIVTTGPGVPAHGEIWDLAFEHSIVEDLISTRSLLTSYRRHADHNSNADGAADVATIAARAAFDHRAREVFIEFGHTLGRVIRQVANSFAPEVIVLGGGISRSSQLFLPAAIHELRNSGIRLQVSTHIGRSALVGAAVHLLSHVADMNGATASHLTGDLE
jgi:glucokinase